jgi:Coenzyme PQQ synthesis protein D (PqqD)
MTQIDQTGEISWRSTPVPAARAIENFSSETVDDEVVLFDCQRIQYHNLNASAFAVWRLCDGQRPIFEISSKLANQGLEIPADSVALAVEQLGEAGLLEAPQETFNSRFHRRTVLKLAAAGAIGAVGIPVVASITGITPNASATHVACTGTVTGNVQQCAGLCGSASNVASCVDIGHPGNDCCCICVN